MDLRLPIGGLFAIFGTVLCFYGVVANKSIYARSLGINVNLDWGVVMLIFGAIMLGFAVTSARSDSAHSQEKF
jgi:hypothetical protein